MWITRRELARLERELSVALRRAERAEESLASERASKDWLVTQLTSRVVTKHGGYGLEHEAPLRQSPPVNPRGFIRDPTDADDAKLDYYKRCFAEAGKSEDEAVALWEAEMRGESPAYPYESEVEQ